MSLYTQFNMSVITKLLPTGCVMLLLRQGLNQFDTNRMISGIYNVGCPGAAQPPERKRSKYTSFN